MADSLQELAELHTLYKEGLLGLEEWESEKLHWLEIFRMETASPSAEQRRLALRLVKDCQAKGLLSEEEAASERSDLLKRSRTSASSSSFPRFAPGQGPEGQDSLEITASQAAPVWNDPPPPSDGAIVFRRYRLERKLGEGAHGMVWLARDQRLKDTPFALKFLRRADLRDPKRRVQRMEACLLAQKLRHPGLLRVYDLLEDEDHGWTALKTEYLEGQTLEALLASPLREGKRPLFPLETLTAWLRQMTDALDYLHSAGILLRTLRPETIFLTEEGRIKISDAGLTKVYTSLAAPPSLSQESPDKEPFLAPEAKAGQEISPATDIFSLGMLFYHLLTGDWPKATSRLLFIQVAALPAAIDEVLRRALAPRPRDRHLRARDLWSAWQDAFQPGPSAALPPELLALLSREPTERAWNILCQAAETLDLSSAQLQTLRIALSAWPAEICAIPQAWAFRWLQGSPPPALSICRSLQLQSQSIDLAGLAALVSSPFVAYLTHLQLFDNPIGPEGVASLAQSPYLKDLSSLDLSTANLGPHGALLLAQASTLPCLTRLYLFGNAIGPEGAAALARSPLLAGLIHLDLGSNDIGDDGAAALAASPHLSRLTQLDLGANGITDAGAVALASSPHLSSLASLDLWGNALGPEGQEALEASPHLQKCRESGGLHL